MVTFKKYLLNEKATRAELNSVLSDSNNFRIGLEFEYVDNSVLYHTVGDYDYYKLVDLYSDFIHRVNNIQLKVFSAHEKWFKKQSKIIKSHIKKLEKNGDPNDEIEILKNAIADKNTQFFDGVEDVKGLDDISLEFDAFEELGDLKLPIIPDDLVDFWFDVITDNNARQEKNIRGAITQAVYQAVYEFNADFDEELMPKAYNVIDYGHFDPQGMSPSYDSIEQGFNFEEFPFKNYVIGGYQEHKDVVNKWRIEVDESIKPKGGGMEIVSPIMSLNDAINVLPKIFEFISNNGETNQSTGLHVNISYKGFNLTKLDTFKMMMFMEEGYIYEHFPERIVSEYLVFLYRNIAGNANINSDKLKSFNKRDIAKANDIIKKSRDNLLTWLQPAPNKLRGINTMSQRGDGNNKKSSRIEFRYLGGSNYENKLDKVKHQILNYAYLIKLGMDKNYKKKEYINKVARMIDIHAEPSPNIIRPDNLERMTLLVVDKVTNDIYMMDTDKTISQYKTNKQGKKQFVGKISKEMLRKKMRNNPDQYVFQG